MTGNQLLEKYEITPETLLAYMRQGLQAIEPRRRKPVLNRDELKGEDARVLTLIEMARLRGQDPGTICVDPDRQEIYARLRKAHYVIFNLPDCGADRSSLIDEIEGFLFVETEFSKYHTLEGAAGRKADGAAIDYRALFNEVDRCYAVYKALEKENSLSTEAWMKEITALGLRMVLPADVQGIQLHQGKRHRSRNITLGIAKNAAQRIGGKQITLKEIEVIKKQP